MRQPKRINRIASLVATAAVCGSLTAGCNTGSRSPTNPPPAPATNPGGGTTGGGGTGGGGGGTTPPASPTLDVAAVTVANAPSGRAVFYRTNDVEVLGLTVAATGDTIDVTSITMTASGTVDETQAVSAVRLFEDVNQNGLVDPQTDNLIVELANNPFPADDGAVTFTGAPLISVPDGSTSRLLVSADLAGVGLAGPTVIFSIAAATDIAATAMGGGTVTINGVPATSAPVTQFTNDHLLISEYCMNRTEQEFIEIHNPTGQTVDLTRYHLTDGTFATGGQYYYNIVTGANFGGQGVSSDFHVRFPAGATIAPGEFIVVARSSDLFSGEYGMNPTYELLQDGAGDGVTDMVPVAPDTVGSFAGLTNDREVIILYMWDGQSDLVQDIDYVVYGDTRDAVDKTGVSVDGPDADTTPSTYAPDTGGSISLGNIAAGSSAGRIDYEESTELKANGGNGITGDDETTEVFPAAFTVLTPPTPFGP